MKVINHYIVRASIATQEKIILPLTSRPPSC